MKELSSSEASYDVGRRSASHSPSSELSNPRSCLREEGGRGEEGGRQEGADVEGEQVEEFERRGTEGEVDGEGG